jgi:phage tail sheath protein FI
MPEYLSPGVYIEEIDSGPKPIEGVGTAMPVFIGFTQKAEFVRREDGEVVIEDLNNRLQLVTSWNQYVESFGDFVDGAYLPLSVYGYFQNGGTRCYVMSLRQIARASGMLRAPAKATLPDPDPTAAGAAANPPQQPKPNARAKTDLAKGIDAVVVTAKRAGLDGERLSVTVDKVDGNTFTLDVRRAKAGVDPKDVKPLERIPVTLKAFTDKEHPSGKAQVDVAYESTRPQFISVAVAEPYRAFVNEVSTLVPEAGQVVVLNLEEDKKKTPTANEFKGVSASDRDLRGIAAIAAKEDITMICVPDLMSRLHISDKEKSNGGVDKTMLKQVQVELIALAESKRDRLLIVDPPPSLTPMEVSDWRMKQAGYDSAYAALYWPWIKLIDPVTNREIEMPPSGHIAGIWARNDTTRGVHKAPANEVVRGATGLAYNASKGEQDTLNPDGINVIRAFPGMGITVWGARTLSRNPSWRYINVRRLFNFVEKSIERNTQWVVFEPNDIRLWGRIRRDVNAFLTTLWRDGMFFGLTPAEAFFVKCDAENNPEATRDQGKLIIEIGIAPSKPAEFVIFRIQQWSPSQEEG